MSNNSTKSLIKLLIVCFIIYVLYKANKENISNLANQISHGISSFRTSDESNAKDVVLNRNVIANETDLPSTDGTEKISSEESLNKNPIVTSSSNIVEKLVGKFMESQPGQVIFEEIIRQNSKDQASTIMVRDIEFGGEQEVECGDSVNILLNTKNETTQHQVSIGSNKLDQYIENGILGMRKGGMRRISFIRQTGGPLQTVTVTLLSIRPKAVQPSLRVLVGKGAQLMNKARVLCGDTITGRITVYDAYENKLFENKNFSFVLGQKPMMQAISNGFVGLPKDKAQVTLIGKPGAFGSLIPASIASKHKLVLVDVVSDGVVS